MRADLSFELCHSKLEVVKLLRLTASLPCIGNPIVRIQEVGAVGDISWSTNRRRHVEIRLSGFARLQRIDVACLPSSCW